MKRSQPFPGFSRGVPIIGEQAEPEIPKGGYYYQIPVLIQRPGHQLEADSFEVQLVRPMMGVALFARMKEITDAVRQRDPELPAPKVIALNPIFLGFVPQEELDRMEAEREQKEKETLPC